MGQTSESLRKGFSQLRETGACPFCHPDNLTTIIKAQTTVLELLERSGVPFRFRTPVRAAILAGRKAVGP